MAFGLPFRQAAVENENALGAEDAKRPPHPRRRIKALAVVDDDGVAIADSEGAGGFAELCRARQHVRQIGRIIAHRFDVEKHRAGNVTVAIFRVSVALLRRQEMGGVDGNDVAVAQVFGQPFGRLEPAVGGGGWRIAFSSQHEFRRMICGRTNGRSVCQRTCLGGSSFIRHLNGRSAHEPFRHRQVFSRRKAGLNSLDS